MRHVLGRSHSQNNILDSKKGPNLGKNDSLSSSGCSPAPTPDAYESPIAVHSVMARLVPCTYNGNRDTKAKRIFDSMFTLSVLKLGNCRRSSLQRRNDDESLV